MTSPVIDRSVTGTNNADDTTTFVFDSQKGGVGKSTMTMLAAEAFNRMGLRVLCIDFDPLGTLSDVMLAKYGKTPLMTVTEWLSSTERHCDILQQGATQLQPGLYILPTDNGLEDVLTDMSSDPGRIFALRATIQAKAGYFDVVCIDAPPSVSALAWAALIAADVVVVPTLLDRTSIKGLRNVIRQIDDVRVNLGAAPTLIGVVANQYDKRNVGDRDAMAELCTEGMPPVLGDLPRRRGRDAWAKLTDAFQPVAHRLCSAASIAVV